jgi:hypothetical protein
MLAAPSVAADLYKWVDADGKVHYSDQPPPPTARSQARVPDALPPSDPDAARRLAEKQAELRKAAEAQADQDRKSADEASAAKQKQSSCAQARGRLQALRDGSPAYRYNEKGEQEMLDDSARRQALRDAEQAIANNCS